MKDYYKILEIQPNASAEDIKKAYRRLSKLLHPDLNMKGAEQFKNINEANSILSDTKKRSEFDMKYNVFLGSKKTNSAQPKTSNTSNTNTYTSNNGSQSTITVNGVKINVTGNNTSINVKFENGKVIIESRN